MASRPSRYLRGTLPYAALGMLVIVTACEGDASTGDAGTADRPGMTGGTGGTGITGGSGGGGGRGGAAGIDGPVDVPPPPPPPVHPEAKKLLPARSVMLGVHRSSCSYGASSMAAGAPRWCAISRPGATLGSLELWVMNVTKATETPPTCSGAGNADCMRLTTALFSAQPDVGPVYPTAHRFYGDTLIYYANALSAPSELYKGPVFAWKPGWPAGKQIGSNNAVLCSGHSRADVAVCIENISPEGVMPVTWDIHAGGLEGGPMKRVATITPVHPMTEASQWGSGFTQMGDYFVFSTPSAATGNRETLFFIKTTDIGTAMPTQVGTPGVSRWTLNAAGTKWFYLKDYNYNREGEPSGTLYMADFPAGGNEVKIQSAAVAPPAMPLIPGGASRGVGTYQVLVDQMDKDAGLGLLVNVVGGRGNYRIMKNPAGSPDDPANVVSVINDIATLPIYSPDLRFHYFAKDVDDMVGTTDSWVLKTDGLTSCALTQTLASSIFGFPFLENAGLVFWMDNFDAATDSGEGWLANPDGCPAASKKKFSNAIDFWFVDGDKGVLYSDDSDGLRVSLRYAPFQGGTLVTMATPIQRQIDRMFAILPNYEGVMFSITSSNQMVDGVYYLKLPVGSGPAGDGGVADAAGN